MIGAFSVVIIFPIIRVIASTLNQVYSNKKQSHVERQKVQELFDRFSAEEKKVIRAFVEAGGSVLSWSRANRLGVSESGVESLMQREILYSTMTADGMREAFVIDTEIFDLAQKVFAEDEDF